MPRRPGLPAPVPTPGRPGARPGPVAPAPLAPGAPMASPYSYNGPSMNLLTPQQFNADQQQPGAAPPRPMPGGGGGGIFQPAKFGDLGGPMGRRFM